MKKIFVVYGPNIDDDYFTTDYGIFTSEAEAKEFVKKAGNDGMFEEKRYYIVERSLNEDYREIIQP